MYFKGCGTCFILAIVSLILLWDTQINLEERYANNAPVLSSLPHQSAYNGNTIESADNKSFSSKISKTKLLSEDSIVYENSKSFLTTTNAESSDDLIQKDSTKKEVEGQLLSEGRTEDSKSKEEEKNLKENDHEATVSQDLVLKDDVKNDVDKKNEIENEKENEKKSTSLDSYKNLSQCPNIPPHLVGRLKVEQNAVDWDQLEKNHNSLLPGGEFSPDCLSDHKGNRTN